MDKEHQQHQQFLRHSSYTPLAGEEVGRGFTEPNTTSPNFARATDRDDSADPYDAKADDSAEAMGKGIHSHYPAQDPNFYHLHKIPTSHSHCSGVSPPMDGPATGPPDLLSHSSPGFAITAGQGKHLDDLTRNPSKVFVGGIGQHTTDESLRRHFSPYGPILEAAVMIDKRTQRSRGFGFIVFATSEAARQCLEERHKIDGVVCDLRMAVPRDEARETPAYDTVASASKIFVGGLPDNLDEGELREAFARFGPIREATLMYDKVNHRPRGFGFVIFESATDAHRALGMHRVKHSECEAKLAQPRSAVERREKFCVITSSGIGHGGLSLHRIPRRHHHCAAIIRPSGQHAASYVLAPHLVPSPGRLSMQQQRSGYYPPAAHGFHHHHLQHQLHHQQQSRSVMGSVLGEEMHHARSPGISDSRPSHTTPTILRRGVTTGLTPGRVPFYIEQEWQTQTVGHDPATEGSIAARHHSHHRQHHLLHPSHHHSDPSLYRGQLRYHREAFPHYPQSDQSCFE